MRVYALLIAVPLAPPPAFAQSMPGMAMPGMSMPGMAMPAPHKPATRPHRKPAPAMPATAPTPKAAMPAMPMAHDMPGMAMDATPPPPTTPSTDPASGTALPAGNAPAPSAPTDHYADRAFDPAMMAAARARMMHEEGGRSFHQILFNLAELQVDRGHAAYRWDGEGWFGGDLSRIVVKSEGEGGRGGVDAAEAQALWSRAIGSYFDAQAGVRHDFAPRAPRTYATIGVEGLAPYEVETEAALFLSTRGELIGRIEGWHDERMTQRLVLQPRVELNLAAQDLRGAGVGAGLSDAELGLRLRYEIAREFAPYAGVSYEAKTGRTADLARTAGREVAGTRFVTGVRFWF